jgi:hypothetical protein
VGYLRDGVVCYLSAEILRKTPGIYIETAATCRNAGNSSSLRSPLYVPNMAHVTSITDLRALDDQTLKTGRKARPGKRSVSSLLWPLHFLNSQIP